MNNKIIISLMKKIEEKEEDKHLLLGNKIKSSEPSLMNLLHLLFEHLGNYYFALKKDMRANKKNLKSKLKKHFMKSNSLLEKAKTFYNENIPKLPDTISQAFDQNMTSENFYNLAFYFIKQNFLSFKIRNNIINKHYHLLSNGINSQFYAKLSEVKHLVTFFHLMKEYNFDEISEMDIVYQSVYRDIIISCLMDYSSISSELYILVINNLQLTKIDKESTLFNLYNKTTKNFTWNNLINIATSKSALQAYYKMAQQQSLFSITGTQTNEEKKQTLEIIKNKIIELLNSYTFYKGNIDLYSRQTYGITCLNKIIIINERLTSKVLITNEYKKQANATIVTTILHELNHVMVRSCNNSNKNSFLAKSSEFKNTLENRIAFVDEDQVMDSKQTIIESNDKINKVKNNEDDLLYYDDDDDYEYEELNKNEKGKKDNENNETNDTLNQFLTINGDILQESGDFFDYITIGNDIMYYSLTTNYLLDENNWNVELSKFVWKFQRLYRYCYENECPFYSLSSSKAKFAPQRLSIENVLPFFRNNLDKQRFLMFFNKEMNY